MNTNKPLHGSIHHYEVPVGVHSIDCNFGDYTVAIKIQRGRPGEIRINNKRFDDVTEQFIKTDGNGIPATSWNLFAIMQLLANLQLTHNPLKDTK